MKKREQPVLLGIDIGNSAVKAARLGDGRVDGGVRREVLKGLGRRSPKAFRALLEPLAGSRARARQIDGVVISSVVPAWTPAAVAAVRRLTAHPPVVVTSRLVLPFELAVPSPHKVGVDRLCCRAGALRGRRRQGVVIDVGAAITVDLVLDRVFKGGVIMAGPNLSLGTLASCTAKLPRLEFPAGTSRWRTRPGINTTAGARIEGAGIQAAGGIRAAVEYLETRAGRKLARIVTGGGFPAISHNFPGIKWDYQPDLLMTGLYSIWELNRPAVEL